ncbi:MAG: bifunctional 3,4-dihydroxy-2-butanone-4-phosphate synthase/GTP cyclohydrolase II [Candidatus Omnitrophica bacterium]|nr:bifunctional 3,4-dihydroxy-2-butanone-4-phosphate synthase/GTP cyclohydrolase II [Candidatus Omnitrophota bacterium]
MKEHKFDEIENILKELSLGGIVVVIDDESRENEGDFLMAADRVKPEDINFMAKHGRGLICIPMEGKRLDELELRPMHEKAEDRFSTAWAISVDARCGITTGISAHDRAHTINVLIGSKTRPEDLIKPGHVFPLRAREGGVLVRAGHTEACVDLMRLAKLYPAGVICEIMNEDGTMARTPELFKIAQNHNLKICTIQALIEYRRKRERLIEKILTTNMPTEKGDFSLSLYQDKIDNGYHLALVMGDKNILSQGPVLTRVHSQCLTGDIFHSLRCDCGAQLNRAMEMIAQEGKGVILYMNQEGRGIGLVEKLKAYALQDRGLDTVEANEALGYEPDLREYGIGAQILFDLGVRKIKLLTNNPRKIIGLEGYGLEVTERVPIEVEPNTMNRKYLETKKKKLGHDLNNV